VKTINLLCAGNKVFVKYQAQGVVVNPRKKTLRTSLMSELQAYHCMTPEQ